MTQIMIDIQPATMRVYQAEAERRGLSGTEFIAALLADWPAVLAPAVHVDDVTPLIPPISTRRVVVFAPTEYSQDQEYAHDFPSGGGF